MIDARSEWAQLLMPDDSIATLIGTTTDPTPGGATVYNLTVNGGHTYFVAGEGSEVDPIGCIMQRYAALVSSPMGSALTAILKQRNSWAMP